MPMNEKADVSDIESEGRLVIVEEEDEAFANPDEDQTPKVKKVSELMCYHRILL